MPSLYREHRPPYPSPQQPSSHLPTSRTLVPSISQAYVKSNPLGQSPASYASAKRESNLT